MPRTQSSRGSSKRGFAAMSEEERRRISAMGGHASHGGQGRGRRNFSDEQDQRRGSSFGGGSIQSGRSRGGAFS